MPNKRRKLATVGQLAEIARIVDHYRENSDVVEPEAVLELIRAVVGKRRARTQPARRLNVVSLRQPTHPGRASRSFSKTTIESLREHLDEAQRGELVGMAMIAQYANKPHDCYVVGDCRRNAMLTAGMGVALEIVLQLSAQTARAAGR